MLPFLLPLLGFITSSTLAIPLSITAPAPYELISAESSNDINNAISKRNVGGVRLCSGTNWTGQCWYGVYQLNTCINLNGYAGHVGSFRPDEQTECFLMQGQCNADADYADFGYDSSDDGDPGVLPWIADAQSYICFKPLS